MSFAVVRAFAQRVGVKLQGVAAIDGIPNCHYSPAGGCGIALDGQTVFYRRSRYHGCTWDEALHEVAHCVWWHPTKGPNAVTNEGVMLVYEFAVVSALHGRNKAHEYLRCSYASCTTIRATVTSASEEWAEFEVGALRKRGPYQKQKWWEVGTRECELRGLLKAGVPTWQRVEWGAMLSQDDMEVPL